MYKTISKEPRYGNVCLTSTGTGTNVKVHGEGHISGRRTRKKFLLVQFGQFRVFCSSTHGASPRAQPFVKVGAVALCLMESALVLTRLRTPPTRLQGQ